MATDTKQVSGVQDLINRLHQDGVAAGQSEAERLIADARVQAMTILDEARRESEAILAAARREKENIIEHGHEALRMAKRDVILRVREAFYEDFKVRLRRLVQFTLQDRKFLEQLILEIARRAVPDDSKLHILLPPAEISENELAAEMVQVQPGSLAAFVLGLTADVLREGLTFSVSDDPSPGVHVQIVEDDVQIELTDQTITPLRLQCLVPRYRAISEKGVGEGG